MFLFLPCLRCPAAPTAHGEHLTAVAQKTSLAATAANLAMYSTGAANVQCWGSTLLLRPGNEQFPETLRRGSAVVLHITATDHAFAAILEDGTVVAWGERCYGGKCSEVKSQLTDAPERRCGSCLCGDPTRCTGGLRLSNMMDTSLLGGIQITVVIADKFMTSKKVRSVQGSERAFGAVITWGDPDWWGGADIAEVQAQLKDVKHCICCNSGRWTGCDLGRFKLVVLIAVVSKTS
eukprot:s2813_g8.t1